MKFRLFSILFIVPLFVSVFIGIPVSYPLLFGLILFSYDAFQKGFSFKDWLGMIQSGLLVVKNMIIIFSLIGLLTAGWRLSGTIPYLVYHGANLIHPSLFYFSSFILTMVMSLLLGSVNGTVTTMGIIIISLARANGANLLITTGAILAGGMYGDRISPVSSSAYLVAELTKTNVIENRRAMFKSSLLPTIITSFIYLIISLLFSGNEINKELLLELKELLNLSHLAVIPALAIITLSFLKVDTKKLLLVSTLLSIGVGIVVQGYGLRESFRFLIFGVNLSEISPEIARIVNGGGFISMFSTILNVTISATYYGIFQKTKFLEPIEKTIERLEEKIGEYLTYLVIAVFFSILFCTQSIVVILITGIYAKRIGNNRLFMLDLENGAILIPALIPWNMAANVAFTVYDVSFLGVAFNFFCMLVPIYYYFYRKKIKKYLTSVGKFC